MLPGRVHTPSRTSSLTTVGPNRGGSFPSISKLSGVHRQGWCTSAPVEPRKMKITPLLWPVAALLLSACGTGGYQQAYTPCAGSAFGCSAPAVNYGYLTSPAPTGHYLRRASPDFSAYGAPPQPPVYQAPPAPQPPPSSSWSFVPSAAAATTSSRREPDPPVAVEHGDGCGWWRLCNFWSGQ